jgi:hypothetical protein
MQDRLMEVSVKLRINLMDEEFCIVDLWAAEAFLTALDAEENGMLEMLKRGDKIHNWMFNETEKKFPEETKKFGYDYTLAKQSVHLSNYGGGPEKMQQVSGLPLYVCDWQSNHYHSTFPGIKRRMHRIGEKIRSTRSLTSVFGRRKIFFGLYGNEMLNQAYAWPSQSAIGELTLLALIKLYYIGKLNENLAQIPKENLKDLPLGLFSLPWVFPSINTHDGMAIRCFRNTRVEVKEAVKEAFNIPIKNKGLETVIPVEIGWADNFNDVKDLEIIRY